MIDLTARTIELLRERGFLVERVERWVSFGAKRSTTNPDTNKFARGVHRDLFGIFDVLSVEPTRIVGIQITSRSNAANRRTKMIESGVIERWKAAGGHAELWKWNKIKGRWTSEVETL